MKYFFKLTSFLLIFVLVLTPSLSLPLNVNASTVSENIEHADLSGNTIDNPDSSDFSNSDDSSTNSEDLNTEDKASDTTATEEPSTPLTNGNELNEDETNEEPSTNEDASTLDSTDNPLDNAGADSEATSYTLTFDYNGGVDSTGATGFTTTVDKGTLLGTQITLANEKKPYTKYLFKNKWIVTYTETGENVYKDGASRGTGSTKKVNANMTLTAEYNTNSLQKFDITYNLNNGNFKDADSVVNTYTCESPTITLPEATKKGYIFKGWYETSNFSSPCITSLDPTKLGDRTVYAKWEVAATKSIPKLKTVKNNKSGVVKITYDKVSDDGLELYMATNKSFKKNKTTVTLSPKKTSYQLTNMPKNKTYYFRLRSYAIDSTGAKKYSSYSNVLSIKVKKGVSEIAAKSNSASFKTCKVTAPNTLYTKFSVSKRVKSSDDSYYLVRIDPSTGKYLKKIASAPKTKTVTFELPVKDENGNNLNQGKFALAIKSGKSYKIISKGLFISNPESLAIYTAAFPTAKTKKGLQGTMDPDYNTDHVFYNIDLNNVLNGTTPYKYNGKTYYFHAPYLYQISEANKANVTVTAQFMISYNSNTKYMLPKAAQKGGSPTNWYAISTETKKARETFEAAMNFLGEAYAKADCHLDNWILGNEANIYKSWYYTGSTDNAQFTKMYANTWRIMYYGIKSSSKNSRAYICTDHTWINRHGDYGAKPFMTAFNKEIKSQNKKIQWNLAYHAYPSILTSSATWKDSYAPNSNDADFVSPKNLNILSSYVKKNFGSGTRIILSEQGFTSTSGTDVQAAAIAYTYYKAEFDPMIDAVIFRSDFDNESESAQGLKMGLRDINGNKKPAYDVFKYMNTTNAETYTKKYLKTIGVSSWKSVAPKYNLSRFK